MPETNNTNNWNEYSKLVLKELETLAIGISNVSNEIQGLKREIALIKDREDKVEKLQEWKEKISEVISPSQLASMYREVEDLKQFKTKAITIFVVVQTLITISISLLHFLSKL